MFTGIVEETGIVRELREEGAGKVLVVEAKLVMDELAIGDSISVAGVCQTVTRLEKNRFEFFAMGETLRATTLGQINAGATVNLERALTPSSRLGGHFVSGHVDGKATIHSISPEGEWSTFRLVMESDLVEQLVPKGSISVDGISLTVGPEVMPDGCEIYIIPHTLEHTTLGKAKPGDRVNIETDLLGKYVMRYLEEGENSRKDSNLMGLLMSHGFTGKN
ncbi:riboflavin synthase [bacterium]|nr:riboflavin synthase [bacterium]